MKKININIRVTYEVALKDVVVIDRRYDEICDIWRNNGDIVDMGMEYPETSKWLINEIEKSKKQEIRYILDDFDETNN